MDTKNTAALDAEQVFGDSKIDHRILNAALALQEENPDKKIVLVSKDICLRLKAKALNLNAEDYETGKIKNLDELYTGTTVTKATDKLINQLNKEAVLTASDLAVNPGHGNHFYLLSGKKASLATFYSAQIDAFEKVKQEPVFNIYPKNPEQACALHALLNPDIKLVTIQGNAGTGKTLIALASALEQRKYYRKFMLPGQLCH
jgi:PhoH-like ATPase